MIEESTSDIPQTLLQTNQLEAELKQAKARAREQEEHFAAKASKPRPTDLKQVRILKEYRTQVPRPGVPNAYDDRLYHVGEIAEMQAWKVKDLIERGVAEEVSA